MSLTSYCFLEVKYPESQMWLLAAKLYHYGDTHLMSLLAHPWGPWQKGDGLPKPVVKPRGVPEDLSFSVRCDYAWSLSDEDDQFERLITKKTAKGYKRLGTTGYVVDPDEWACSTWLTKAEITLADQQYREFHSKKRRSPELAAMLGIMTAYERFHLDMQTRVVLWYG